MRGMLLKTILEGIESGKYLTLELKKLHPKVSGEVINESEYMLSP
jgi:hypothetical protein